VLSGEGEWEFNNIHACKNSNFIECYALKNTHISRMLGVVWGGGGCVARDGRHVTAACQLQSRITHRDTFMSSCVQMSVHAWVCSLGWAACNRCSPAAKQDHTQGYIHV